VPTLQAGLNQGRAGICRLRRKLGDDARLPTLIKTVRNGGYVFTQQVPRGVDVLRAA